MEETLNYYIGEFYKPCRGRSIIWSFHNYTSASVLGCDSARSSPKHSGQVFGS